MLTWDEIGKIGLKECRDAQIWMTEARHIDQLEKKQKYYNQLGDFTEVDRMIREEEKKMFKRILGMIYGLCMMIGAVWAPFECYIWISKNSPIVDLNFLIFIGIIVAVGLMEIFRDGWKTFWRQIH